MPSNKYSQLLSERNPAFVPKNKYQKQTNIINYQDQILDGKGRLKSRDRLYTNRKKGKR